MMRHSLLLALMIFASVFYGCSDYSEGYRLRGGEMRYYTGFSPGGDIAAYHSLDMSEVDLDSFEVFGPDSQFAKDKDSVFCTANLIEGADPGTFRVIGDNFAVDKANGYQWHVKFGYCYIYKVEEDIDPESFTQISEYYSKDKTGVYYFNDRIKGADPYSFHLLEGEDNYLYYIGVDDDSVHYRTLQFPDANPKTFRIMDAPFYYTDGYRIYDLKNPEGPRTSIEIIASKDKDDIEFPGYCYYIINGELFHCGVKVQGADLQSFKVLETVDGIDKPFTSLARDKDHLFYDGRIIENLDMENYKFLTPNFILSDNRLLCLQGIIDKEFVPLENVDLRSLEVIGDMTLSDNIGKIESGYCAAFDNIGRNRNKNQQD